MKYYLLVAFILLILYFLGVILYSKTKNLESFDNIPERIGCTNYDQPKLQKECNPGFIKCSSCGIYNCNGFCMINESRAIPNPIKIKKETLKSKKCEVDCPPCERTTCPLCPICPKSCPDINLYIKKCDIPSCPPQPDLDEYIKKKKIPKCPKCPDMSLYILKDKIPKCDPCPRCLDCSNSNKYDKSKCPICASCPKPICPQTNCQKIIRLPNTKLVDYTIPQLELIIEKSKKNNIKSACNDELLYSNLKDKCLIIEPKAFNCQGSLFKSIN